MTRRPYNSERDKEYHRLYQQRWRAKNNEKYKEYRREYDKKYRETHLEKVRLYDREYNARTMESLAIYGLKKEDYERMLSSQDWKCAICKSPTPNSTWHKRFHVDHDKNTGKIRGLLCSKCNLGLGLFNHDINLLKEAIKYLEFWRKN